MVDDVVKKSISYIERHLDASLSLELLAREMGFSKYHFHRIFKKHSGKSVTDYIRSRKIARAAYLLLYTEQRVLDIALISGFESQEAFTRIFKKTYALPPRQVPGTDAGVYRARGGPSNEGDQRVDDYGIESGKIRVRL